MFYIKTNKQKMARFHTSVKCLMICNSSNSENSNTAYSCFQLECIRISPVCHPKVEIQLHDWLKVLNDIIKRPITTTDSWIFKN